MKTRLATRFGAVILIGALFTAACGSGDDADSPSKPDGGSSQGLDIDYGSLSGTLNGSGSSFQLPLQEAMRAGFAEAAPGVTVNYPGGGSGKGKTELQGNVVDYAGSDSLPKPEDLSLYKGGDVLYFPVAAAPITVAYQLKGVSELQLSPDTMAKIFQTEITSWDDAAIKADNPGVSLPATKILVAHRSDGSGTTNNFTSYLTKAAPTTWTLGKGDTVNWAGSTQAGNGNQGVAQLVGNGSGSLKGTNGAIGYVDFSDAVALNLATAAVKNADGKFVAPTLAGVSKALDQAALADDMSFDPLNAPGPDTYPIATPTWMLVYKNQTNKAKGEALRGFINYILTDGQDLYAEANYAQLPDTFREKALAQLETLVIAAS